MYINLTQMPTGWTYESQYNGFLEIFKSIAETPREERVMVVNPPVCWIPLLEYLDCWVQGDQCYFDRDKLLKPFYTLTDWDLMDRTGYEVLCGFRPELVDALWKCDMQWNTTHLRRLDLQKEFVATNNGSFHRPEVKNYLLELLQFHPTKRNVVLIPCAADKPYPAALHQAVLDRLPDDYYLMVGTGVLGLVPQDLWAIAPSYDSGLPNRWRLMIAVRDYFTKYPHDKIVVYHDFYSMAIHYGLQLTGIPKENISFINPIQEYDDYLDLLASDRLKLLEDALTEEYV